MTDGQTEINLKARVCALFTAIHNERRKLTKAQKLEAVVFNVCFYGLSHFYIFVCNEFVNE